MNILVYSSPEDLSAAAGSYIAAEIIEKPNCTLGLATGSTPIGTYAKLIKLYEEGILDCSEITTFNLDEYIGLDEENENSYHSFMHKNLVDRINILQENINFPNGNAKDIEEECTDYEDRIKEHGGIDLQLLGLGSNGHIAFNEPSDCFADITHEVELKESTIKDNSRFFASVDEVPTKAVTMGIGSIMRAKKILLLATGKNKAEAVKTFLCDNPTPKCPASILRFHQNVTVMLDSEAAFLL